MGELLPVIRRIVSECNLVVYEFGRTVMRQKFHFLNTVKYLLLIRKTRAVEWKGKQLKGNNTDRAYKNVLFFFIILFFTHSNRILRNEMASRRRTHTNTNSAARLFSRKSIIMSRVASKAFRNWPGCVRKPGLAR